MLFCYLLSGHWVCLYCMYLAHIYPPKIWDAQIHTGRARTTPHTHILTHAHKDTHSHTRHKSAVEGYCMLKHSRFNSSLYIQYTSQKYTVSLPRRAVRYKKIICNSKQQIFTRKKNKLHLNRARMCDCECVYLGLWRVVHFSVGVCGGVTVRWDSGVVR